MKCCSNKPSWSRLLSIVTLTPFLFLGCSGGRDGPERFELNGKVTRPARTLGQFGKMGSCAAEAF